MELGRKKYQNFDSYTPISYEEYLVTTPSKETYPVKVTVIILSFALLVGAIALGVKLGKK